jgi:hypothetical protein
VPRPKRLKPKLRYLLCLNNEKILPIRTKGRMNESVLKAKNSTVTVVPIFVPRIIPMERLNVNCPAAIKPIVITITAELLCKMAVTIIPKISPFKGESFNFYNHLFIRSPDMLNNPILKMVIPAKNKIIKRTNIKIESKSITPWFMYMVDDGKTCPK